MISILFSFVTMIMFCCAAFFPAPTKEGKKDNWRMFMALGNMNGFLTIMYAIKELAK